MTTPKITTFNGFTFSYEEKCVEEIAFDEYCEVYSDIIVLESNNPKFKKGDKIEQITIACTVHFEYKDGREY